AEEDRVAEGELAGVAPQDVPALAEVGPEEDQDQDVSRVIVHHEAEQGQHEEESGPDIDRIDLRPRTLVGCQGTSIHCFAPSRPVGLNSSTSTKIANTTRCLSDGCGSRAPRFSAMPIRNPPSRAPIRLPIPPRTTVTKAIRTKMSATSGDNRK